MPPWLHVSPVDSASHRSMIHVIHDVPELALFAPDAGIYP